MVANNKIMRMFGAAKEACVSRGGLFQDVVAFCDVLGQSPAARTIWNSMAPILAYANINTPTHKAHTADELFSPRHMRALTL